MRAIVFGVLTLMTATQPAAVGAGEAALAPFVAEYEVRYGRLGVGTSRTEVSRIAGAQWTIESATSATGLARIIASGVLKQRSEFVLLADGPRPQSYVFDDGTKRTGHDVSLRFDWHSGRVRGTAEDQPVDVATVDNLQDAASFQAFVLARLRTGQEPGIVAMIEKDKVKYYRYTFLRRESLATAIGQVDTVVYRSARDGSDRETITWHAPQLGYTVVQAEQLVNGKRGFQTYVRRYQPGP